MLPSLVPQLTNSKWVGEPDYKEPTNLDNEHMELCKKLD